MDLIVEMLIGMGELMLIMGFSALVMFLVWLVKEAIFKKQ
jgi:hypothetical protein